MSSPSVAFEKSLALLKAHALLTDDELVQKMEACVAEKRQAVLASQKKTKGWMQNAREKASNLFELQQNQFQLKMYERGLEALKGKDYQAPEVRGFAQNYLDPGYKDTFFDGMEPDQTPSWRLSELNERTARHPELTAIWSDWLQSAKPLRKINLRILENATWQCKLAQEAEKNAQQDAENRQEAAAKIRRRGP